ncbi:unnamed protein product [Musa acuminata subsp. malaccensis]|uniref:Hexosyltransferase n=1 Tax=Musa acuminata subsp. malaccensis TaxID=214687 RepID=A0A804KZK1_MUSAM|nr:PREDICTED: beta-1,3-galactosyltransferase 6-like [Musa acuminata subsp. malaccensis]CAG1854414.1 unnamed protein product [Musa acuminata subsp. malaccensis]
MEKLHPPAPRIPLSNASTAAFVILSMLLTAFVFLAVYPNEFQLQSLVAGGCEPRRLRSTNFLDPVALPAPDPQLRILIGVLTVPDSYQRRHLLRDAYFLQPNLTVNARIDIRFVLCGLTTEEQRVLVAIEILRHGDIMILDCEENMNEGKTYTYFSNLPGVFNGSTGGETAYDYVLKADDDTYIRLDALAKTLDGMPREDLYMGLFIPCKNITDRMGWMTGMAYALSWDLVEWIARSEIPRNHKTLPPHGEDVVLASWLRDASLGKNRFDMNPRMYDYYEEPTPCWSHDFIPDTIAVHKLKNDTKWAKTLDYFNLTVGLRPSNLYNIHQLKR